MNILFNVSTRRGIISILPLMKELRLRGHNIFTLVTTHPSSGLRHPHKFMVGDDENMCELLDGVTEYEIFPSFDTIRMMNHVRQWDIDIHITKGDSGMPRDDYICSSLRSVLPGVRILAQQADWHMWIGNHFYSEKFMVMGPRWKEYLIEHGVSEENIDIVGCIKGDYLKTIPHGSDKYITFFSQMDYTENQKINTFNGLEFLAHETCLTLVVKLHPAWVQYNVDEMGWWKKLIGDRSVILTDTADPYECISNSKLTVTAFSNTGYESLIMGVPILIVNIIGRTEFYEGCGVDVYDPGYIAMTGFKILDGNYDKGKLDRWLLNQIGFTDGSASVRAANCIERYCS